MGHVTSCIDFLLNTGNSDAFAVTRLLSLDARYWLLIASLSISLSDLKRYHAPPLYDLPPNPLIKSLWMRSPNPSSALRASFEFLKVGTKKDQKRDEDDARSCETCWWEHLLLSRGNTYC